MTDSNVPMPGERGPSVPPPSLDSELVSFAGQLYVPKLSSKEMIVCLALVVVLIGIDFRMSAIETGAIKPLPHGAVTVAAPWWTNMIWDLSVASFAACLVASGILIRNGCFRILGQLQPGHWIVLILATAGIVRHIATPFDSLRFASTSPHSWGQYTFVAMMWLRILVVGGLCAFAAIRLQDAKRWKVLLVSGSVGVFFYALPLMLPFTRSTSFLLQGYHWFLPCWSAIIVAIALVAVSVDWPRRAARDWVHWLGVSLWTLASLASLCTSLHMTIAWLVMH